MLSVFLAAPAIPNKPEPGAAQNELEALLERVRLLADLAGRDPDCLQSMADDHRQNINVRLVCLLALQKAGKDQTKTLLSFLHDEKDLSRRIILTLSMARADKTAVPELIKLLDDPDPYLRIAAVKALVPHHAAEALPKAKHLLEDLKSTEFAMDLYRLVAGIGTREAKETLANELRAEVIRQPKREEIFYVLMAFEQATGQHWMEAGPHPVGYYHEKAMRALQWWEKQNPKP
jgi:hypothetical protein